MLEQPKILKEIETIKLEIKLHHPWIVLVRICAKSVPRPSRVKNVRINTIDQDTVLITWNDKEYVNYKRCIRTYEIYYSPSIDEESEKWEPIAQNVHIPYLSYCYHVSVPNQRLQGILSTLFSQNLLNSIYYSSIYFYLSGYYKIRAMDIFGRFGEFSKISKYQRINSSSIENIKH